MTETPETPEPPGPSLHPPPAAGNPAHGPGTAPPVPPDEVARKDQLWAQQGEQFAAARVATTAAGADTSGPGERQRRFRSGTGPRFTGRGLLGVFGLLGLLLTIAIMAVLAVKVLDGMSNSVSPDSSDTGDGALPVLPGAPVAPLPGGADVEPGSLTDTAQAAACSSELSALTTAVQAYEVLHGSPPPDVATLVTEGVVEEPDGGFSFEIGAGGTLQATGDCATN